MVVSAGPCHLSEAEVIQFSRPYEPQWFHCDSVAAGNGRFGGPDTPSLTGRWCKLDSAAS